MSHILDILKSERKLKPFFQDRKLTRTLGANWNTIFGNLAQEFVYGFVKKGILHIGVRNYMWVNEIRFYEDILLKRIQGFCKKNAVSGIQIFKLQLEEEKTSGTGLNNLNQKKSLKELIIAENQRKTDAGFHLCARCQKTLTIAPVCVFCKTRPVEIKGGETHGQFDQKTTQKNA